MQKILRNSYVYRLLSAFFSRVNLVWHKSKIVTWFLSPGIGMAVTESSIFTKFGRYLHRNQSHLFDKLKLTRKFENSIFKETFIWCLLPAALAPIIPTMAVLCFVAVGFFSLFVRLGCQRELRLKYFSINKYIVIFAFVYLAATFMSVTFSGSLQSGLLIVVFTLFCIVFQNAVTSKRQIDLVIQVLIFAGVAVSLFGIYQYIFYSPDSADAWIDSDMFSNITKRVYSTLENPNVLSEYLLLIIPFSGAAVLTGKSWRTRLLFLGCTAIMVLCMIFTFSRGGYLGLIVAVGIFLIILDSRFLILGIIGIIVLYFILPDTIIGRFASIGDLSDGSTSYRVSIWIGTLAMLHDYWLSGIGPSTAAFNLVYPAYSYNTITAPHSHNLFLQIICDCGITGIILFFMILFQFFRTTATAVSKEKDKDSRIYLIASISSICGFLLQGMTDYSFYNFRVMLMFWIVLALGLILTQRSKMVEGNLLWSKS